MSGGPERPTRRTRGRVATPAPVPPETAPPTPNRIPPRRSPGAVLQGRQPLRRPVDGAHRPGPAGVGLAAPAPGGAAPPPGGAAPPARGPRPRGGAAAGGGPRRGGRRPRPGRPLAGTEGGGRVEE